MKHKIYIYGTDDRDDGNILRYHCILYEKYDQTKKPIPE